jgi:hypothetical protein
VIKSKSKPAMATLKAAEPEIIKPVKVGRPTKYRPEFCDTVVRLGERGDSITQMSVALGINTAQFYRWQEAIPEFRSAVKVALEKSMAWWEDLGRTGCKMGKDFNAVTYIFIMKNRFKEHYNDTKQIDVEHSFLKTWQAISDQRMKRVEHTTQNN